MSTKHLLRLLAALAALASLGAAPTRAEEPTTPAGVTFDSFAYLPITIGTPGVTPPSDLPFDPAATHSGEGTYYAATGEGNCSFDASPGNLMVAALNTADYQGSVMCGAYIEVTGPNGSVTVRVVDRCPECAPGDVDMSPQAFQLIAPLVQGRVPITWRLLSPPIAGNISYKFKEGSHQWWTAVQIRNHRNPIYKVEYRAGDGSWVTMPRESYNYFLEASGAGPGAITLRVTDIYGNEIVKTIPIWVGGQVIAGDAQLPAAP